MVSNLALMGFDETSKRMILLALNPGVTMQQVVENTGFEMLIANTVGHNAPPSDQELLVLRNEVDPDRLYI